MDIGSVLGVQTTADGTLAGSAGSSELGRDEFLKLLNSVDVTDPELMNLMQQLATVQFHGARIPIWWMMNTDVNGDFMIDDDDEDLLLRAMDYHVDVNLDGEVNWNDIRS